MTQPILSLVTICFKNPRELEQTLLSVKNHYDPEAMELVVVDGSPNNSCQRVLLKHPWVDRVIHEEDDGRYDAMNKGASFAQGSHLIFLNSGDFLYPKLNATEVLKKLSAPESDNKIFFGDTIKKIGSHYFLQHCASSVTRKDFARDTAPCHQSVIIPKSYFEKNLYNTKLSVSADTALMIDAFETLPSEHLGCVISVFSLGGVSNNWTSLSQLYNHHVESTKARNLPTIRSHIALLKKLIKFPLVKYLGVESYYLLSYMAKPKKNKYVRFCNMHNKS
ncbi:glycosyltransferase [Halorhodospira halochloris]|uniref:glycosyltransferase n=1 Tax=Halorhodospira halochloris TaxID=1052 RepID=UPI001EE851D1|nr:glycosyltransferase [Halorhodospira halochloris]MCG5548930.1 glycosyltransferase [Halorhodospira halochloris]